MASLVSSMPRFGSYFAFCRTSGVHWTPLAMARMLLVCKATSPLWLAMAASMRCMPPDSAKEINPERRLPTSADNASTPTSCAADSPAACSMTVIAAGIPPMSTRTCGKSEQLSVVTKVRAKLSQPSASPWPMAVGPSSTKRRATWPTVATSFEIICENSGGTKARFSLLPLATARKNFASGLWLSCSADGGRGPEGSTPSGQVSAAMTRAMASPAFCTASAPSLSFASGVLDAAARTAPMTPGPHNFFSARGWS
mmetsp:Transcript_47931/g.145787  ORF Transcript_47931/g.145787 Transcript_47931/m.145787 type:complete len:255 (-) Transcript_47931:480-1244(-)